MTPPPRPPPSGDRPTGTVARPHVGARLAPGWERLVDPAWLEGWQPRCFDLGDGGTEVVTLGTGAPLLLLPPLPGYKEAWIASAGRLARHHRVIVADLRARFAGPPRWAALLDDLDRIVDALVEGPALVVGHSLGGALAQQYALRRPERVSGLVLSSTFARLSTPPSHWGKRYVEQAWVLASQRLLPEAWAASAARALAAREAWVYDRRCDPRLLAFVRHGIRRQSIAHAARCVSLAARHDTRAGLGRLACRALVLVGERESRWAQAAADELAAALPRAELRRSPGVNHLHPLSSPDWLADTVTAWARAG